MKRKIALLGILGCLLVAGGVALFAHWQYQQRELTAITITSDVYTIHSFCLMRNHYDLVIETPNPNLVASMGSTQGQPMLQENKPE